VILIGRFFRYFIVFAQDTEKKAGIELHPTEKFEYNVHDKKFCYYGAFCYETSCNIPFGSPDA